MGSIVNATTDGLVLDAQCAQVCVCPTRVPTVAVAATALGASYASARMDSPEQLVCPKLTNAGPRLVEWDQPVLILSVVIVASARWAEADRIAKRRLTNVNHDLASTEECAEMVPQASLVCAQPDGQDWYVR